LKLLVERARTGKFTPDDLAGGTFTITNLGAFGIDVFDPIIVAGQAAILGVGRIAEKPVVIGGQVVVRSMMNLCLSFDHRILDGAPAARFLQRLKDLLENPMMILL
jgi:pyruvate dehydrogenase E2 component (dihydrolipoamide acetyltransferase)